MARLDADEVEVAERLVRRAAELAYDPHDEGWPGIRGAAQIVYELVSDQLELSAEDDPAWLGTAIGVHAFMTGPGRTDLESVLHGFVLQRDLFSLSPAEQRLIRKNFGRAPLEADLGDGPDITVEERVVIIDSLLDSARALRSAYGVDA